MTAPQTFRKKPLEVQAMQWDGSKDRAYELDAWTARLIDRPDAGSVRYAIQFMLLNSDDARDTLGESEVLDRLHAGYTAVVYDVLHGTWVNVATGQWIIRGVQGEFYPIDAQVLVDTYDRVETVVAGDDPNVYPDECYDGDYLNKVQG